MQGAWLQVAVLATFPGNCKARHENTNWYAIGTEVWGARNLGYEASAQAICVKEGLLQFAPSVARPPALQSLSQLLQAAKLP